MKITSDVILSRLDLAREGAGTIPVIADLDLIRNHPNAVVLHGILLWMSFQQDAVQHVSLEDLRENVLHWSRDRFYRAIAVLEEKGYLQRHSIPSKGTELRVFVLPNGEDYSENRKKLFRKSEEAPPTNPVYKRICEALNNNKYINTHNNVCEKSVLDEILEEYINQIASRTEIHNRVGFRKAVMEAIAAGEIYTELLQKAMKRVLFPLGEYKIEGGRVKWNGDFGIVSYSDGRGKGDVIYELPEDAVRIGEVK